MIGHDVFPLADRFELALKVVNAPIAVKKLRIALIYNAENAVMSVGRPYAEGGHHSGPSHVKSRRRCRLTPAGSAAAEHVLIARDLGIEQDVAQSFNRELRRLWERA